MTVAIRREGPDAAVVIVGAYRLELASHCVDELIGNCRSLLDALARPPAADDDTDLRAQLPGVAASARLHSWLFPCFMAWMPVLVFATDGPATAIYTRTLSEAEGMPLVILEPRDVEEPAHVATDDLLLEIQTFLAAADLR